VSSGSLVQQYSAQPRLLYQLKFHLIRQAAFAKHLRHGAGSIQEATQVKGAFAAQLPEN
jgi:hypothetical protein